MPKLLAVALFLALSAPAAAEVHSFGPFLLDDEYPTALVLNGPIEADTPIHFHRALRAFPGVEVVGLNSMGGDVFGGLSLALEVADRGLFTIIPEGQSCNSACAYVFLAGTSRHVAGSLGAHMPTVAELSSEDRVGVEMSIRYVLGALDVPMIVFDAIFNTPNADLRVFSAAEAADLGLNR